jgi:hypothetical protein
VLAFYPELQSERDLNDSDYQQIIKCVIIVIVAGFLGQFVKSFATHLIERTREKKAHATSEKLEEVVSPPTEPAPQAPIFETAKAEKKRRIEFSECPLSRFALPHKGFTTILDKSRELRFKILIGHCREIFL